LIVQGPDAGPVLSRLSANDVARKVGRLVYTPWLNRAGGIVADLTVTRLGDAKFLVVASDIIHRRIEPLIRRETRAGEFVTVTDVTSGTTLLTVQGPASRELISRLTDADLSNQAFPYLSAREVHVGYAPVLRAARHLRRRTRLGTACAGRVRGRRLRRPDVRRGRSGDQERRLVGHVGPAAGERLPRHGR